jgi:hypothetical protein
MLCALDMVVYLQFEIIKGEEEQVGQAHILIVGMLCC